MNFAKSQCFFALVAFLAYCQVGTCLECYSCFGTNLDNVNIKAPFEGLEYTKTCVDPTDKTQLKATTCPQANLACIKLTQKLGETMITARGCLPAETCTGSEKSCFSCKTSLCNSSSGVVPSVLAISVFGLFLIKYNW